MFNRLMPFLVVLCCTAVSIGCGSQSKTSSQPAAQAPMFAPVDAVSTEQSDKLKKIEIRKKVVDAKLMVAELQRQYEFLDRESHDNDPARTAYLKALSSMRSDLNSLEDSIGTREPKHDDLMEKFRAFTKKFGEAADAFKKESEAENWGTVRGRVEVSEIPPERKSDMWEGVTIPNETLLVDANTRGIANAVVSLKVKPSKIHKGLTENLPKEVICEIKSRRFSPHVLAWNVGQTLKVLSEDSVRHDVKPDARKNFLLQAEVRPGDSTTFRAREPERIRVTSDGRGWMYAYWIVTDHPYIAVTKEDGTFEIPNLPSGEHEFLVWHESNWKIHSRENPLRVNVETNKTTEIPTITVQAVSFSN
jgi:plastocyanin